MLSAPALAFDIAGRLLCTAVLGFAIFRGGAPLLFLWGLWIEEVLSLAGLSLRQLMLRRPPLGGRYYLFPATHLVFVLAFSLAGTTGMFSDPSAPRLAAPSLRSVLALAGVFAFWTVVDLVRTALRRRASATGAEEEGRTAREAWLALFLPHVTIIAGGFCLIIFRLGNWMAWGILAGKVLFEAVSFAVTRGASGGRIVGGGSGGEGTTSASGRVS